MYEHALTHAVSFPGLRNQHEMIRYLCTRWYTGIAAGHWIRVVEERYVDDRVFPSNRVFYQQPIGQTVVIARFYYTPAIYATRVNSRPVLLETQEGEKEDKQVVLEQERGTLASPIAIIGHKNGLLPKTYNPGPWPPRGKEARSKTSFLE